MVPAGQCGILTLSNPGRRQLRPGGRESRLQVGVNSIAGGWKRLSFHGTE